MWRDPPEGGWARHAPLACLATNDTPRRPPAIVTPRQLKWRDGVAVFNEVVILDCFKALGAVLADAGGNMEPFA